MIDRRQTLLAADLTLTEGKQPDFVFLPMVEQ